MRKIAKRSMKKIAFAGFLFTFGFLNAALGQSVCDSALVKSTYNLGSYVGSDWRLADLVDQNTYEQIKHDAGANAEIYGVPVGASYGDFKNQVAALRKQHNESLSHAEQLNVAWTGLDPNAPSAYRDCLNNQVFNMPGLRAAVTGATKSDISILIKWTVPGEPSVTFTWSGTRGAVFENDLPTSMNQGEQTIIVPRPDREFSIAANAPHYSTGRIVLEPLPPPPPPAKLTATPTYPYINRCGMRIMAPPPPGWLDTCCGERECR
jgi:hypothetical protein